MYWQSGAKQRQLRLIVIAPTPYRKSKKLYYRNPAYLLTTDLGSSLQQLLQIYFDRRQVEPVLAVAAYSALWLASLQAFGTSHVAAKRQTPFLP